MLSARGFLGKTKYDSFAWVTVNRVMWWRRLHRPDVHVPLHLCGISVRYAWPVIPGWLTADSVVYSFGIGRDASFEQELMVSYGCPVHAFDPSPRSIDWVRQQNFGPQFQFREFGISDQDGELLIAPPKHAGDVSYSALTVTRNIVETQHVPVRTLPSIMGELGHDRLDLLKMDVEGMEHRVLAHIINAITVRPAQLLVEFHQGFYGCTPDMTRQSVAALHDAGYRIFWLSDRGLEYAFVHQEALQRHQGIGPGRAA